MSVIYFQSNILDLLILITYQYQKLREKIVLTGIRFLKTENEIYQYLANSKLEIKKPRNSIEQNAIDNIKMEINEYLSGKTVNLFEKMNEMKVELALDEKFTSDFSKRVINHLLKECKYGVVTTYYEIGEKIGSKAYRAIGNVLKKNPLPLVIPCHRVVKKSGEVGGFMGMTDNNWQQNLKKHLLKLEGFKC